MKEFFKDLFYATALTAVGAIIGALATLIILRSGVNLTLPQVDIRYENVNYDLRLSAEDGTIR